MKTWGIRVITHLLGAVLTLVVTFAIRVGVTTLIAIPLNVAPAQIGTFLVRLDWPHPDFSIVNALFTMACAIPAMLVVRLIAGVGWPVRLGLGGVVMICVVIMAALLAMHLAVQALPAQRAEAFFLAIIGFVLISFPVSVFLHRRAEASVGRKLVREFE